MNAKEETHLGSGPISYEKAKKLARSTSEAVRKELASRTDIRPEILYFLAEDASAEVRRAAAANAALPVQADLLLARDRDQGVREGLAEKIAKLAPSLSADDQDKIHQMAYEALETLARDQVTRVRQVLSEALKDVADAPADLIRGLALDVELVVSGPILEFSPVLTDEDLLEIIGNNPIPGALGAIARRARVSGPVSDAVALTDDVMAVADLLANPSAQIREETLDTIIDRALDIEPWHMPLVRRPALPATCALRLANFVADNLLDILMERQDLEPEALEEVRAVVHRRLREDGGSEPQGLDATRDETDEDYDPVAEVEALDADGKLSVETVEKALARKERLFVRAALAHMADVPSDIVGVIFKSRSAKGVMALAWKAGMEPRHGLDFQEQLLRLPPRDLVEPLEDGAWPMSDEEMTAELHHYKDLAGV